MARAYNNILAMLIATIGLAIPLTANMHTPKLIEMFLRDRTNQVMLGFFAFGAAHVLWVAYLVGPDFAPLWAIRFAVFGALIGWIVLVPYFFYVIRFLDPSNILARLQEDVTRLVDRASTGKVATQVAHEQIHERLHHIGTILLKSVDRADRSVVLEGIWSLKRILDHYGTCKAKMPADWFRAERKDLIGMSAEAIALVNAERTWFEHRVLTQIFLAYQSALAKTQDIVSALSDTLRIIATHAAQRQDDKVLELAVRFFNNDLREAIKRKDAHAVYDLLYQYRVLAGDLCDHPEMLKQISHRIRHYAELAQAAGLGIVPQIAGFDLCWIISRACERRSPAVSDVLSQLLALKHRAGGEPLLLLIKAKVILGAYLMEHQLDAEANRVRANLRDVPSDALETVETDLLSLTESSFWEVTDRQVNFEWVPPERRGHVRAFIASLRDAPAVA
jgi:hypothetical protein